MIVRETEQHFICIEQNHHAHIAKQIISQWESYFLADDPFSDDVLYAIEQHDVGWHFFDEKPIWNDQANQPYTFIDLPLLMKTVLYTHGVDIVQNRNPYAAALCGAHYTKFLRKYDIEEVQQYIRRENLRRKRILQAYPEINETTFNKHLALLQLADNMSLYICLHEAGNNNEQHRYFKKGIHIPNTIDKNNVQFISTNWLNMNTIELKNIETVKSFSISIQEKIIPKKLIEQDGFSTAYEKTSSKKRNVKFEIS